MRPMPRLLLSVVIVTLGGCGWLVGDEGYFRDRGDDYRTAKSIPRTGRKQLMKPGCKTNAGKTIGVRVNATLRGDVSYYRLYCKISNTKKRAVSKNSSGAYCKTGALYIQTYGYKLRLRITCCLLYTSDAADE